MPHYIQTKMFFLITIFKSIYTLLIVINIIHKHTLFKKSFLIISFDTLYNISDKNKLFFSTKSCTL